MVLPINLEEAEMEPQSLNWSVSPTNITDTLSDVGMKKK